MAEFWLVTSLSKCCTSDDDDKGDLGASSSSGIISGDEVLGEGKLSLRI